MKGSRLHLYIYVIYRLRRPKHNPFDNLSSTFYYSYMEHFYWGLFFCKTSCQKSSTSYLCDNIGTNFILDDVAIFSEVIDGLCKTVKFKAPLNILFIHELLNWFYYDLIKFALITRSSSCQSCDQIRNDYQLTYSKSAISIGKILLKFKFFVRKWIFFDRWQKYWNRKSDLGKNNIIKSNHHFFRRKKFIFSFHLEFPSSRWMKRELKIIYRFLQCEQNSMFVLD